MKSERDLTFLRRVQKLRLVLDCGWEDVCQRLGISRTMLHLLRKGDSRPSDKVLHRLAEAEMEAGIRRRPVQKGRGVLQFLMAQPSGGRRRAAAAPATPGVAVVRVNYRGSPPADAKAEIELRAPKEVAVAANLMVRALLDEDVETLVLECLPPALASVEFLNLLEPASFLELVEAAAELTFGADWRERFAEQFKRATDKAQAGS